MNIRWAVRQTDRVRSKRTDRRAGRDSNKKAEARQTDTMMLRRTGKQIETDGQEDRQTNRERQPDTPTCRQIVRRTDKDHIQIHFQQTDRQTDRQSVPPVPSERSVGSLPLRQVC